MNLFILKATCAAFHGVEVADLNIGPVDLFLVAANNVRKQLEKVHNFQLTRCTATLDVDGVSGGRLADAVTDPPDIFNGLREVIGVSGLRSTGDFVPLDFTSAERSIEEDRYELELSDNFWPSARYPSDRQFLAAAGSSQLVMRAGTMYNFPRVNQTTSEPLTVYIEGYGWLKDYTVAQLNDVDGPAQDFLIEHGFEYFQWKCIDHLNQKFQTYVPRQEGNVGPPKEQIAQAYRDLLVWDTYQLDPHATQQR